MTADASMCDMCVHRITSPVILSLCLEWKWLGFSSWLVEEGPSRPVCELEGITDTFCFLLCSRGQGEEAIAGVPEQQPVDHRWRGHPSAGGDGDHRHLVLETVPHGQAGLPA